MPRPVIVSVSRRTDIPAFHGPWFAACLDRGEARYRNPRSGVPSRVSLAREDVAAFVFWTRNPAPFMPVLERLEADGIPFVVHVTVTGFPRELEPAVPSLAASADAVRSLAAGVGPARVLWRFDPLLPGEDPRSLARRFEAVASALSGAAGRCTLSVAHPYRKSVRATRRLPGLWDPAPGFADAVRRLADSARLRGFDVRACGSPALEALGIPPGACVDAPLLRALFPGAAIPAVAVPSRPGCRCAASRDVGTYRTCAHGCLYCYAA